MNAKFRCLDVFVDKVEIIVVGDKSENVEHKTENVVENNPGVYVTTTTIFKDNKFEVIEQVTSDKSGRQMNRYR